MELAVIGGGQAGSRHARLLQRAIEHGRLAAGSRVLVVDRDAACLAASEFSDALVVADWSGFLDGWMASAPEGSFVVPAPVAPHLLWEWLAGETGARPAEPPLDWALPYEVKAGPGSAYLSAAAWICPESCVEPAHCPVLHAPRDWDLGEIIRERAVELGYAPAVFQLQPIAWGVAGIPVSSMRAVRDSLRSAQGARVLVATTSRCHAAIGGLALR